MDSHVTNLLNACGASSLDVRKSAEDELETLKNLKLGEFVTALANILVDESKEEYLRQLAGLVLKNAISSKDKRENNEYAKKWLALPEDVTNDVKKNVMEAMKSVGRNGRSTNVSRAACQTLSKIAKIELLFDRWPDFFPSLLKLITEGISAHKHASLVAIRYLCEDLVEVSEETGLNPLKKHYCNEILTSVIQGMRDECHLVKAAAAKALFNALLFAKENYENVSERNFIMQVVCNNCKVNNEDVQIASFECLVQIAAEYYIYLAPYMHAIGSMTLDAIQNGSEQVAIPAMEFWNAICEAELDIEYRESGVKDKNTLIQKVDGGSGLDGSGGVSICKGYENHHFIKQAMNHLIPILLETLTKQEAEDTEIDTWTVAMAAATCLSLCSQVLRNDIVPSILEFVRKNFSSDDWKRREAAILAFGCIMEGPDEVQLQPLVKDSLPDLCKVLSDGSVAVRDTAAWTIGRIVAAHWEVAFMILNGCGESSRNNLMSVIVGRLRDCPRVAVHICWIVNGLAESIEKFAHRQCGNLAAIVAETGNLSEANEKLLNNFSVVSNLAINVDASIITSPLDPLFEDLCDELIKVAERNDAGERSLREASYSCLGSLIKAVGVNCGDTVQKLLLHFLLQLENSFLYEQNEKTRSIQGNICGCIQCIITTFSGSALGQSDRIWQCIYKILLCGQSNDISEDALLVMSALANEMGIGFQKYMPDASRLIVNGLSRIEETQTCRICTELVGDVSRALGDKFSFYSEAVLKLIYETLSNPAADRKLKPPLMVAVGDVAMAITFQFVKFLDLFMQILSQAGSTTHEMGPVDNEDWMQYMADLRDGVLQAYSGIVYGMKDGNTLDKLKNHVSSMLHMVQVVIDTPVQYFSPSNLKSAIALTGDLVSAYGNELCSAIVSTNWLNNMVQKATSSPDYDGLHSKVQWLRQVLLHYRGVR